MHSITEHWSPPYIEITQFGEYSDAYMNDLEAVIVRYARQFDQFALMEVQHGTASNASWRLIQTAGRISVDLASAFKRLIAVAIVSDEPAFIYRLTAALPRSGSAEFRLFSLHQIDDARRWVAASLAP
jgi:hypothetical protein